jgi:NAD(P)-dependent dehydrogenase (short-subunit alcohol dehydrogenase family)
MSTADGWLSGRGVIMTAAAAGIGRVVADAFVRQGARVHLCDVDEAAVADAGASSPLITASRVDLADAEAIERWLSVTIDALGVVDVLVNNAGTKGPTAFVEHVTDAEWSHCLSVSLDSHFRCARRVAPVMKVQRHGSIINMSSMAGVYGYGMRSPYAVAKWAIIGLTKSLAIELGPHDVRCNAICPGSVAGPRMDAVIAAEAARRGISEGQVEHEYLAGQSIKRFVEPSEIADLCLFLSTPASRMITGQAIAIDGHTEAYHL